MSTHRSVINFLLLLKAHIHECLNGTVSNTVTVKQLVNIGITHFNRVRVMLEDRPYRWIRYIEIQERIRGSTENREG